MVKAVLLDFGGVVFKNKEEYEGPKGPLKIDPEMWRQARLGQADEEKFLEGLEALGMETILFTATSDLREKLGRMSLDGLSF